MTTIVCYDIHGQAHPTPSEEAIFRPAAYGIFIENKHILLIQQEKTGLWYPPGGVLNEKETPSQGVRRHFRRATGMVPELGPLVFVEDQYLYEDDQAWHLSVLYYALKRPSATTSSVSEPNSKITRAWIELNALRRERMQFGYEAIRAGQLHLKL